MTPARLALLLAALATASSARPARAQPDKVDRADIPAKARTLAERGRQHHEAGDYAAAIAAFTEAYALAPSPALLFNLAQSYRMGGHCEDAATMYKRFLATDPPPDARVLAETHLTAVEQCAEASRPVAPVGKPVLAAHVVASSPSEREHRAMIERDTGLGLGIAGGLVLVGAGAYEIGAHRASNAVSSGYAHGAAWSTIAAADARGHHDAAVADVLGVTGVAAVGAGVALYWLGTREARASHIAVVPAPHGAEVHAAWRF